MRRAIAICHLAVAFTATTIPARLPAQGGIVPYSRIPPGMAEAPEVVMTKFLRRRAEVTRTTPTVRMCGPTTVALMTEEIMAWLTRREYRLVDSIEVSPACPPRDSTPPWGWSPAFLPGTDFLAIMQMSTGPLNSTIDALVGLHVAEDGLLPRSWRERFEWDHQRGGIAGDYLSFTDFSYTGTSVEPGGRDHNQYPPAPKGLSVSPERVLSRFLQVRWAVTRTLPTVRFCGPDAAALLTPTMIARLSEGRAALAGSIVVDASCPGPGIAPWYSSETPPHNADLVVVTSMKFGALASSIEALVRPTGIGGPPYPSHRREQFEWDHVPNGRGMVLTFSNFLPPP